MAFSFAAIIDRVKNIWQENVTRKPTHPLPSVGRLCIKLANTKRTDSKQITLLGSLKNKVSRIFGQTKSGAKKVGDAFSMPTEPETHCCVNDIGELLPLSRSFRFFADHYQFYLLDRDMEPESPLDFSEENMAIRMFAAQYIIAVYPTRDLDIPVEIEIRESEPENQFNKWVHVVEGSLELSSGHLELSELSGPIAKFYLPPGTYRVRALFGNLNSMLPDELEGEDFYKIILWPAKKDKISVLKWRKEIHL